MDSIMCSQGDSWPVAASLTDVLGSGLDLSSAEVYWSLKEQLTGSASDFVVSGIALSATSGGMISGTIDPSLTELIPSGRYYEEIQISLDGTVSRFRRYRVVRPVVGFVTAPVTPPPPPLE